MSYEFLAFGLTFGLVAWIIVSVLLFSDYIQERKLTPRNLAKIIFWPLVIIFWILWFPVMVWTNKWAC